MKKERNNRNGYKAGELAEMVEGNLKGDPFLVINGVSGIQESSPNTITFAETCKYMTRAESSEAGLVIVPENISESNKDILQVENPRLAYAKIASLFAPEPYFKPGIHPSAMISASVTLGEEVSIHPHVVIDQNAEIGDNVRLGPGVYIGPEVRIGANTIIHPNVVVEYDTVIGNQVIIHAGTIIGSDGYGFVTVEDGHHKIPQLGNVIIEDDVEIGANVTVDRGASGPTVIHQGTKIDNLVQIGHNVKIGAENLIVAQAGIAGSTKLGNRVTLAGQVGVAGHLKIGDNVTVATNSVVTKDTPDSVFYSGNPAHDHRQELKEQATRRKLPELRKKIKKLEQRLEKLEE